MTSTSYREPGLGGSQEMESLMKRAAEMDRTKLLRRVSYPALMRYLSRAGIFAK